MCVKRSIGFYVILVFVLNPRPILANDEGILNGLFTIYPGARIRSVTLNLTDLQSGEQASLTDSPGSLSYDINMKFKDYDFPGTRWGYTTFANIGSIETRSQFAGVDGNPVEIVNINTTSSGSYAYIVPTIYYKPRATGFVNAEARFGLGIGYGNISVSGIAKFGSGREISGTTPSTGFSMNAIGSTTFTAFYNITFANKSNLRVAITTLLFSNSVYSADMSEFSIAYNYALTLI